MQKNRVEIIFFAATLLKVKKIYNRRGSEICTNPYNLCKNAAFFSIFLAILMSFQPRQTAT